MQVASLAGYSSLGHSFALYYFPLIGLYDLVLVCLDIDDVAVQVLHSFLEAEERLLKS